jgi:SAM-dependent methyltransferase
MALTQASLDRMNAEFWNELCGTGLAKSLGLTDHSPETLRRFDEAYLGFYPYLLPIIRPERMAGRQVLEVGLGYGTLGQKIIEAGARYTGLDIAPNAVRMMNARMEIQGLAGTAQLGSALHMPFSSESFDFVVSIGCMHHTGNVQRCCDETWRVLRPEGIAILMVYNKFSFRQWTRWPFRTGLELLRDWRILRSRQQLIEAQRRAYDHNGAGAAAPETVLLGTRQLRKMLNRFGHVVLQKQNADPIALKGKILISREKLLANLGRLLGLDIYIEAKKVYTPQPARDADQQASLAKAG